MLNLNIICNLLVYYRRAASYGYDKLNICTLLFDVQTSNMNVSPPQYHLKESGLIIFNLSVMTATLIEFRKPNVGLIKDFHYSLVDEVNRQTTSAFNRPRPYLFQ